MVLPSEETSWLQLLQTLAEVGCSSFRFCGRGGALDAGFVAGGWSLQLQSVVEVEAWAMRSSFSAAIDRTVHG